MGLLWRRPEDQKPGKSQVRSCSYVPVDSRGEIGPRFGREQPVDDYGGDEDGRQRTPKIVQQAYPAYDASQRLNSLRHSTSLD